MDTHTTQQKFRFGEFELDTEAGELRRDGARLKLQPQPLKLLALLVRRSGALVSREEIRQELWDEGTYVDFDQAVNFCIKQIRDGLRDQSDRPLFIQTVPKRGYRFIAPVQPGGAAPRPPSGGGTTMRLQKVLWANIAELKLAEERRRRMTRLAGGAVLLLVGAALTMYLLR